MRWGWVLVVIFIAFLLEGGRKTMKLFSISLIALVAIATITSATPAEAMTVCKSNHNCREVPNHSVAGRPDWDRGGHGSYGYSGSWSYGGGYRGDNVGSNMEMGSNGGDSACRIECTNVGIFLYNKCVKECVANDGHKDKPQGQVIRGDVETVYSRTDAEPTANDPQGAPTGGSVDCATLERICRGTTGEAARECWQSLDECKYGSR
jgi:hypothetical protein